MVKVKKVFYGWWIVLSSAILNLLSGASFYYGFTVFFNPIKDTFLWTSTQTSLAFTLQRFEAGLLAPIAGILIDRVPSRILVLFGWICVGVGFISMSYINSLWAFYGCFILISIGFSFGTTNVTNTVVSRWFKNKRSRALTFIYIGGGLSGILVPLVALAIERYEWRPVLFWMGIGLLIIGVFLSLIMRDSPRRYGYLPDGEIPKDNSTKDIKSALKPGNNAENVSAPPPSLTVREALKTTSFWMMGFAYLFQMLGTSAVMVHVVPYLESLGISTTIASMMVTGMTLCSLIGRLGFGLLGDFRNKRYLIAMALTLQTIGLFIFAFAREDAPWLLILFLLTYAPGYGGPIPLRSAIQADYFGTKSLGTLMGLMSTITMVGSLLGPIFAGWVYDATGSYHSAWMIIATATIPGVILILLAKPPRIRQTT
ncbi:MAG: MFS transporter [Dehalococcoidales bacterium]|nr:MFS transporter [Dehalococcoidales bacterium]